LHFWQSRKYQTGGLWLQRAPDHSLLIPPRINRSHASRARCRKQSRWAKKTGRN